MNINSDFKIFQVTNVEQIKEALKTGLIQLYQEIFAEPPYQEYFSKDEVISLFTSYTTEGILLLSYLQNIVIGFCATVPFTKSAIYGEEIEVSKGVSHILSTICLKESFGLDPKSTWYMADLGVRKDQRQRGLAHQLIKVSLNALEHNVKNVLLDTSEDSVQVQSLYHSCGFQLIPNKAREVAQMRQDGIVKTDRRLFMIKKISIILADTVS